MVRVPNIESAERHQARIRREIIAEQRKFLQDFDRQVAELDSRNNRADAREPKRPNPSKR